ncbi:MULTISPECIES: Crp/Fnr family transcriptional regulator [Comamonas]|uniref:Crp/Fnr family transcriptional regulator n=2 Tax=Comamonas TaxID=283 RepID=A0A2A7V040_COMTR|nr:MULTISPECIES: Crp/Fnr family transcriptional regulator [Comamonas]MBD9532368.1 Crp/Fnr family transcriptional regulator [Comamonas sp. CMM01]MBV7418370.1 Crp/Fnr family transcriptional regulator [Comamonas sp. CMM03]MDH0048261.1 Crp/Fnr family transcriptional regulator [Comamonas terrigena]MDH0510669.1 Crp/Fnr family transcriptional regulator [Comamonas terrigena]MDH1090424.1 Crp/Fnr family transcriptional regulator [Comamonas terrigena]
MASLSVSSPPLLRSDDAGAAPAPAPVPASWQALQTMPLLAHLGEADLQSLATRFRWRLLEPGQPLPDAFDEGRLNLIVHGRLWVRYYGSQGREMIVGDLMPGQWCGNHWLGECSQPPSVPLVVEAADASLIATLEGHEVKALFDRDPAVMEGMLSALLQGMNRLVWSLVARLVEMGTLSVGGRLHARLLMLAERAGVQNNQALLQPAPTQVSLAALLGSSREEVAREMSRLTRLGLLQREGRGLRLTNVDGLRVLLEDMR